MEEAAERPPDALLLRQVVAGDVDALEQLFHAYQRQVYQFAFGITRNAETAEEVLQDVFYRLYVHADRIDTTLPLMPWLYRVTANAAYNRVRRHSFWTEPFHALTERVFAPLRRSPEYVAEQRELQTIVRETLGELPAKQRAVLILYYLHDYSVQEIALILEQPEGTIKSRLHHARKRLKERLLWRYGASAILPD